MESLDSGAKYNSNNSDSGDQNATSVFTIGEEVLAYCGTHLYKAKVRYADPLKDKYFIHYHGWGKNWDEVVGAASLLKQTKENLEKRQELLKKWGVNKNAKSRRSTQSKPKGSTVGRHKRRKLESGMEEMDTVPADKHVIQIPAMKEKKLLDDAIHEEKETIPPNSTAIWIPATLSVKISDDENFVTQQGKLVKLPRTPSVDDILKQFLDYKSNKDAQTAESVGEFLESLRTDFDNMLRAKILYTQEHQQFNAHISVNTSPSTIYGAEHLLRFIGKLPAILTAANMVDEILTSTVQNLNDLLKVLEENQNAFFLSTYDAPQGVEASFREENDKQRQS